MSSWLKRIAQRWHDEPAAATARQAEISQVFYKRSLQPSTEAFFTELLSLFSPGGALPEAELRLLIAELRGGWGAENALQEGISEHLRFWRELAHRSNSPCALACYADTLLFAERDEEAMEAFEEAFRGEPCLVREIGDDLATHAENLGGTHWFRYRLSVLRSALGGQGDLEDDSIRELYSELLEEFSGDSDALGEIRCIGDALLRAVATGDMPRALMLRRD